MGDMLTEGLFSFLQCLVASLMFEHKPLCPCDSECFIQLESHVFSFMSCDTVSIKTNSVTSK